jgi:hypothetical protein
MKKENIIVIIFLTFLFLLPVFIHLFLLYDTNKQQKERLPLKHYIRLEDNEFGFQYIMFPEDLSRVVIKHSDYEYLTTEKVK